VVIEATYGWYWAVDLLREAGFSVHLAHPSGNDWGKRRVKNDERDARDHPPARRCGDRYCFAGVGFALLSREASLFALPGESLKASSPAPLHATKPRRQPVSPGTASAVASARNGNERGRRQVDA
jgi:hypothetical protein